MHELAEKIQQKDIRALAKAITVVENDAADKLPLLSDIFSLQKQAHLIGITGAPGAGKSSLVNRLVSLVRSKGLTIAIIAVDPSSPFSGGALLGDRARMNAHFADPGVYIRSMATRGSLGGLARTTKDAVRICGAYGFDVVLVETVGVGQSELDVMTVTDTTVLVLTPNSGDILQVFKAGIMEIADLFVINKADLPGVEKLEMLLKDYLMIAGQTDFSASIIKTVSTENKGLKMLWSQLEQHRHHLAASERGIERKARKLQQEIRELIREEMDREMAAFLGNNEAFSAAVRKAGADPYQLAALWFAKWKKERH